MSPRGTSDLELGITVSDTAQPELDFHVGWDGPQDPHNPQNWKRSKKWGVTIVVSAYSLIAPISSSMVAPCLPSISSEFAITNSFLSQMILSSFVLAWGFGPLFLGPLSEIYGRSVVLQLSNVFYLIFNLACGLSHSGWQMIIFRTLSGLGGSAPLAVRDFDIITCAHS